MPAASNRLARAVEKSTAATAHGVSAGPGRRNHVLPTWLGAVAIAAITLASYLPALWAGYVWDDSDHVTQAPIQRTVTVLKWVWFKLGATPQYYPLTHTTFWLEYRLWGMNPAGYHAVNIVLHIACALLVWRLLLRLNVAGAWLIAAIFAVHPVHVESVAWITERKNTLSAFFYLLAFLAAIRAFSLSDAVASRQRPARRPYLAYAACLACFVLAVLSKTVTCTLPAVLALALWWKHGRVSRRDGIMLAPMFLIALAFAKLTSGMEQWNVGAVGAEFDISPARRVLIAGRALWFYAGKLLWPHPLIFMYPRWNVDARAAWQWFFPLAAAVLVAGLFFLRRRIGRGPLTAVLFFIGTLFPALGFVNVYPMRFSFVADHFQYLASIGLIALFVQGAIAMFAGRLGSLKWAGSICAAIALLTLAALTWRQCLAYKDAATLWRDTLAKNPGCWLAMDNLGADAAGRGDRTAAYNWYARALAIPPRQQEAHISLGQLFETERPPRFDDAEREFAAAGEIRPDDARPRHQLAKLYAAEGRLPAALSEYERVLSMEPRLESARMEYANLLRLLNRPADAEAQYHKAIELNPDSTDARSALAGMYYLAGDLKDALTLIGEAIDLNRTDPALFNNAGVFLMSANRPTDAAEQFRSAIALDPNFADSYDGLGNALAAEGDKAQAARMFRKALELKPDFAAARQHLENLAGK